MFGKFCVLTKWIIYYHIVRATLLVKNNLQLNWTLIFENGQILDTVLFGLVKDLLGLIFRF